MFGQIITTSLAICVTLVLGQDTHYCPDGWVVADIGGIVDCILMGGVGEFVTKQDAEVLCEAHDGWLVDLDEGRGGQKNEFIKQLIMKLPTLFHEDTMMMLHKKYLNLTA